MPSPSEREKQFQLLTVAQMQKYAQQLTQWVEHCGRVDENAVEHITFGRFSEYPPLGSLRLFRHIHYEVKKPGDDRASGPLVMCSVHCYFHDVLLSLRDNNNRAMSQIVAKLLTREVTPPRGHYRAGRSQDRLFKLRFDWIFIRKTGFRSEVPYESERYRQCLLMIDFLAHTHFTVPAKNIKRTL